MPSISKILFPVDFSLASQGAARYAEFLAGSLDAELTMLHVVGNGEHNLAQDLLPGRERQLAAFMA